VFISFIPLALLLSGSAKTPILGVDTDWRGVSIAALVADPQKYHGKQVLVRGYVRLEFEGNAIYLHRDDYKYGISENGIWLNVKNCARRDGSSFRAGYAMVVGTFSAIDHGHLGMWQGEITTSKCTELFPRKEN
jgi:hypothetical protein